MPHGDNTAAFGTWRPNHDDTSPVQVAGRDETVFVIVEPEILHRRTPTLEHLVRIGEIEASVLESLGSLRWIEADVHADLCIPN